MTPSVAVLQRVPTVLLHDHLDGGLRPTTVLDLADACGYAGLPATDPDTLQRWFTAAASRGGLVGYLSCFTHTLAVLQTPDSLARVAEEAVQDLADDGIVYAELRFAPELHLDKGLTLAAAVDSVLSGLAAGVRVAETAGTPIQVRLLVSALRHRGRSLEVAQLASAFLRRGVVGFDLAGPEDGFPVSGHVAALEHADAVALPVTLHAGEAAGPGSVSQAVTIGRARRIGHGVRLIDEVARDAAGDPAGVLVLGPTARLVRDHQIPLEVCPTSNLQTGVATALASHPVDQLRRAGFLVTVNTDNRLLGDVTLSTELHACAAAFSWDLADIEQLTRDAARATFCSESEQRDLLDQVAAGFAAVRHAGAPATG